MAYPSLMYEEALTECNLQTHNDRRDGALKKLFVAMQEPGHKLRHLLPPKRKVHYLRADIRNLMLCQRSRQIDLKIVLFTIAYLTFSLLI